jgi:hypothetical protein
MQRLCDRHENRCLRKWIVSLSPVRIPKIGLEEFVTPGEASHMFFEDVEERVVEITSMPQATGNDDITSPFAR